MGQMLHGCAKTTAAIRLSIQKSEESLIKLAKRYAINPKTVQKWRKRKSVEDARMGPKNPRSTVLTPEEEAACVAFRKHTLLPLDDCLYALQETIPHLTRSTLHRLFKRHSISRLPKDETKSPKRKPFKTYPIEYMHIDIAQLRTEEGKPYLFWPSIVHPNSPTLRSFPSKAKCKQLGSSAILSRPCLTKFTQC